MRGTTLLLACPSLLFSSLLRALWLATVSTAHEVDQSLTPTWTSVCFINVERGRFCCLDRMSWTVNTQSELKTV